MTCDIELPLCLQHIVSCVLPCRVVQANMVVTMLMRVRTQMLNTLVTMQRGRDEAHWTIDGFTWDLTRGSCTSSVHLCTA